MKRIFLLAVLFLLPLASAIDLEMKTEFSQGETLLMKFSGSFQDKITKNNIFFYRDHVRIPIDYDLMTIGNDYYVYALLKNKSPRNYSIALENARYYQQGKIVEDKISKNFTVLENFTDFAINPGFITTIEDFEIQLQNFQETEITIDINPGTIQSESETEEEGGFFDFLFENLFLSLTGKITFNIEEPNSVTLLPGEIKKIDFELGEIPEPILYTISFSTTNTQYEFPVYIFASVVSEIKIPEETSDETQEDTSSEISDETTSDETIEEEEGESIIDSIIRIFSGTPDETTEDTDDETQDGYTVSLDFNPSELKVSLFPNITKEETIELVNVGDEILEEVTLELTENLKPYINLSITEISDFEIDTPMEIGLRFNFINNTEQTIKGELTARRPGETEDISITFEMLVEDSTSLDTSTISRTCEDINGILFEEPQECLGEVKFTNDGNCCRGNVKAPQKSNISLVVGWAIIMLIVLALVWFFKFKYKAGKHEIDLFKISKGKK